MINKEIERISEIVASLKKKSKKVVLIHGVFDLFHNGHLYTLLKAKALGDILVVGLDSDRLVKLIKGIKRPIQHLKERKLLLNNIKCVDYTFTIDHNYTKIEDRKRFFEYLYSKISPNIFASGKKDNWSVFQHRICKKYNIGFKIIGESPGKNSTTSIINKILRKYS